MGASVNGDSDDNTRTRLQQEQRRVYREKLLQAAQAVFNRKTYSASSIGDIAKEADVSRATFYRHFANKIAIVSALTDGLAASLHVAHDRFSDAEVVDDAFLQDWIRANIAACQANAAIIQTVREAAAIEPVFFRDHSIEHHAQAIAKLGMSLPAFRLASSRDAAGATARIRAHLLMRQLDMLCYDIAIAEWTESLDVGCRELARQFMTFIEEFGSDT